MKEMVDLVGIEPTTFPAGRDALRNFSVCNYVKQRTRRIWWTWSGSNRRPSRQAGTRSGSFPYVIMSNKEHEGNGGPGRDRTDDLPGRPVRDQEVFCM